MLTTTNHVSQPLRRRFGLAPAALAAIAALALTACGGGEDTHSHNNDAAFEKSAKYTVGGTISGLGADDTLALTLDYVNYDVLGNGSFTLSQQLSKGASYGVGFFPAPGFDCTIANALGTIDKANITNVAITCVRQQPITLKYQVSGLPEGESVLLNAFGGYLPMVTTNGTFDLGSNFLPFDQYIFGISGQSTGAGCSVAPEDQFGFLMPEPNPRILQVTCGAATPS